MKSRRPVNSDASRIERSTRYMRGRLRRELERGDTKLETFINRFLDVATILKWPIRVGVIAVGLLVISGTALPSLKSIPGGASLIGLFFLPELVVVVVGNLHHRVVFPNALDKSDKAALSAFDAQSGSFCVFLRPFEFDGCFFVNIPTISPFGLLNGLTVDVEAHLSSMTKELRMPLVALGGSPRQDFRAGRSGRTVTADIEWKDKVAKAIDGSNAVFIIPASNPGTLWELELILSRPELLTKTLFIMPPRPARRPLVALRRPEYPKFVDNYEMRWIEAQTVSAQRGINLPDYTRDGAIFFFSELHAPAQVLAGLLPMTDEGTERTIAFLIDRAGPEFHELF